MITVFENLFLVCASISILVLTIVGICFACELACEFVKEIIKIFRK